MSEERKTDNLEMVESKESGEKSSLKKNASKIAVWIIELSIILILLLTITSPITIPSTYA